MKFSILLIATVLFSCAARKDGCGTSKDVQKFDKKPFRVMRVVRNGNNATVTVRRYHDVRTYYYQCLPDSIFPGSIINL